jgi:hypothetical protein
MGFEPMNTGFADQRVSHFAIGALAAAPFGHQTRRCNAVRFILQQ